MHWSVFVQVWNSVFTSSAQYATALGQCIKPFWMDKVACTEQIIVDQQSYVPAAPAPDVPLPLSDIALPPDDGPLPLTRTTYEQLWKESVLCFRLMLTTLSKEQTLDFMTKVHQLRYGERAHLDPLCNLTSRYVHPALPPPPPAVDSDDEPIRPKVVKNPEKQRHSRGRRPNFGAAPKPRGKPKKQ